MARKIQDDIPEKARLKISHEEFKQKLAERITTGEQLLAKGPQQQTNYYGVRKMPGTYDEEFYEKLRIWSDYNAELLNRLFDIANNEYHLSYTNEGALAGLYSNNLDKSHCEELKAKINNLKSLYERVDLIETLAPTQQTSQQAAPANGSNRVFIVHGHDSELRGEVELLVEKLECEPIVLFKEASGGDTIIEKIERYASEASFAIVLY